VAEATTASLLKVIAGLNADPSVNAILLQLPVPDSVDQFALFDAIDPDKDLDAVGSSSVGGFYRGRWGRFIPCTPRGVLTLLDYYKVPVEGARAVVVGRSDIAGKPMAVILGGRMRNATVTWCHRKTRDLPALCREADILIPCVGAEVVGGGPYFITAEMVKPGACVIDVGFRRVGPGKFAGDVDFEAVKEVAGWITLNPGGTGPMTVVAWPVLAAVFAWRPPRRWRAVLAGGAAGLAVAAAVAAAIAWRTAGDTPLPPYVSTGDARVALRTYMETTDPHRQPLTVRSPIGLVAPINLGGSGVKVRPNGFPKGVDEQKTLEQIGKALHEIAEYGNGYGMQIRLEVHGPGTQEIPNTKKIMEVADHDYARICWNCNPTDTKGPGLEANFNSVRKYFGDTIHIHDFATEYPWDEFYKLLKQSNYESWTLLEESKVPKDIVEAMKLFREKWEMVTG
jgi:5,10-methylene-tetrahydrofolate dehydrogenase/methenyl tetrahydrofolate cyclohydrolase